MRYASIRTMDISNGENLGVSLFVQGCDFHCLNCFNSDTWDFKGGKKWDLDIENKFIELANKPHIKRISILGGEPLADLNISTIFNLVKKLKETYPDKKIWLYTGYTIESIIHDSIAKPKSKRCKLRREILNYCDIVVDGPYIDSKKDSKLKWKGSSNQRVIDMNKTLDTMSVIGFSEMDEKLLREKKRIVARVDIIDMIDNTISIYK